MEFRRLFVAIRFYVLAFGFLFLVFGSIYGLFVDEIALRIGSDPAFHVSLTGWRKNALCLLGLVVAGIISSFPIILALYRALSRGAP